MYTGKKNHEKIVFTIITNNERVSNCSQNNNNENVLKIIIIFTNN